MCSMRKAFCRRSAITARRLEARGAGSRGAPDRRLAAWQAHRLGGATSVLAVLAVLAILAGTSAASAQTLTARDVVERIKANVGVPWHRPTVDTFKAGDPATPVTGVAVTMMATVDVLQRAVASGANVVITHEPVFFGHLDRTDTLEREGDPVFAAKRAYIADHGLVIWRFHDHWHARRPDGIQAGLVHALGWEKYRVPGSDDDVFELPATTVEELARSVAKRLGSRAPRIVGDPAMRVTQVALIGGFPGFDAQRHLLQRDDVEALIMGEAHEWETIAYAADAAAQGRRKALIMLGHTPSEQAGMEEAARWLRGLLPEVKVTFVGAEDPFRAVR